MGRDAVARLESVCPAVGCLGKGGGCDLVWLQGENILQSYQGGGLECQGEGLLNG